MKVSEIVARLRGINTPVGGLTWDPLEADVTVARRVLFFLEDRRVLYANEASEVAEFAVTSVQEIRQYLTKELNDQERGKELTDHLFALRAACRNFLSTFGSPDDASSLDIPAAGLESLQDNRLQEALGVFRTVCGFHIAQLAVKYGIDLEGELEGLVESVHMALPAEPDEEAKN